jgi:hypothetical protein
MTRNTTRNKFLLMAFSILVVQLGVVWSQQMAAPNNDNDNGPIQSGYAVLTPGAPTGLLAFETFGQHHGNATVQAGVLPANLTTDALLFVNTSGRLSRNLGVAIANPNPTAADITMTLRDDEGATVGTATFSVAVHAQVSKFVTELFSSQNMVSRDLTGTLEVKSNAPVAIIGLRFRGNNFSTLPATSLSASSPVPVIGAGIGGPGAIILPQFATGGGWATEIVLANIGATALAVRVDLFGKDGSPLVARLNGQTASTFNVTIPAGGVVTLAPRNSMGDSDF